MHFAFISNADSNLRRACSPQIERHICNRLRLREVRKIEALKTAQKRALRRDSQADCDTKIDEKCASRFLVFLLRKIKAIRENFF